MADGPHSRDLRRGRYSQAGQVYLLTMVCVDRAPAFADFRAARCVIRGMHEPSVSSLAETLAFIVMPDHVHWLLQLSDGARLGEVVRRFKARVSLGLGSSIWQRGFHDHAARRDADLVELARYIVANPVRAGLVRRVRDYPHWDAVWLNL